MKDAAAVHGTVAPVNTGPADPNEWLEYQFSKHKSKMMKRNKWASILLVIFLFVILTFVAIAFIPSQSEDPDAYLRTFDSQQRPVDMSDVLGSTQMEVTVELQRGWADFFLLDEDGYDRSYPNHEAMEEEAMEYKLQSGWFQYSATLPPGKYYLIITRASEDTSYTFKSTYFPFRPLLLPGMAVGLAGTAGGALWFSRTRKQLRALLQELKVARQKLQVQAYHGIYGQAAAPNGGAGGGVGTGYRGPGGTTGGGHGGPGGTTGGGHGGPGGSAGGGHGGPGGSAGGGHGGPGGSAGGGHGGPGGSAGGGYGGQGGSPGGYRPGGPASGGAPPRGPTGGHRPH